MLGFLKCQTRTLNNVPGGHRVEFSSTPPPYSFTCVVTNQVLESAVDFFVLFYEMGKILFLMS